MIVDAACVPSDIRYPLVRPIIRGKTSKLDIIVVDGHVCKMSEKCHL